MIMRHIKKFNQSSDVWKDEVLKMINEKKASWQIMDILRGKIDYIRDGIWDISDIDFISMLAPYSVKENGEWRLTTKSELDEHINKLSDFFDKYPNCVVADAYQTEHPFFLSEKPTVKVKSIGSGFNRGSNNIIDNCPKRILICGEDD